MIYFVKLDSGAIKIGCTNNLEMRMREVAQMRGTETSLLCTMPGGRKEERSLHEKFAHLRLGTTEQFRPAPELLDFIGKPLLADADHESVKCQPYKRTAPTNIKFTEEEVARIRELGEVCGTPGRPASMARVIRIAIDELYKAEIEADENLSES